MFALTENGPELSTEKQKDAEPSDDILLNLRQVTLTDGSTSCILERSDTRPVSNLSAEQIGLIKVLFEDFSNKGARFTEWLTASDLNKSTFKRYRIALLAGKHVEETDKYYFVSDATCEALDCPDMKYRPKPLLGDQQAPHKAGEQGLGILAASDFVKEESYLPWLQTPI